MFYRKNLPMWERIIRSATGVAIITYGVLAMPSALLSYIVIASGFMAVATGFVGFCPMCAMVGRKPINENK